ncbi:MAG: hypothetical protein QOJ81_1111 [Chloroflexota bacterium]|nr:hypothetical protein [Chloroflexota bacterium]
MSSPVANLHPPACSDSTLVWDSQDERLLLATCVNQVDPADHEQIWSWDGATWTLASDEGPAPLVVTAVAWDSRRNVLVRYGGLPFDSNGCVPETWEWDGTDWKQVNVSTQLYPPACDHMKLAYDIERSRTVLFGGGRLQELSPETWSWDGEAWSVLASSGPAPRAHHGFVFDPNHQQAFLYGGIDNSSIFDDFWSWDGQTWTKLDFAGPGTRSHSGFAGSPDGLLLFGGATGNSTFGTLSDETWFFTDGGWTSLDIPGPSPRGSPALAWDPGREIWVLYGGFDATGAELGDAWEFDGSTWSCVDRC